MIFPFNPSSQQNQVFNPVLDGNTYVATIEWNVFAQRWYLRLNDTSGNLIVYKAVVSSQDPQPLASLSWKQGVVTAGTVNPHWIPLGAQAVLLLQGDTPSAFDGVYTGTATGTNEFTYELANDPGALVQLGSYGGIDDLTAGLFHTSIFIYSASAGAFEAIP